MIQKGPCTTRQYHPSYIENHEEHARKCSFDAIGMPTLIFTIILFTHKYYTVREGTFIIERSKQQSPKKNRITKYTHTDHTEIIL